MASIGILTCQILELEIGDLIAADSGITSVSVVEDPHSLRLIERLEAERGMVLFRLTDVNGFGPPESGGLHVIIQVLELALHRRKQSLQEGILQAAEEMAPRVDVLFLGYGLCGNALEKVDQLLAPLRTPVFLPMDEDHPVDDCVGLLLGGRETYYQEQCAMAGTYFVTPGWANHWQHLFTSEVGGLSVTMARRLFKDYERSLLITTPIMDGKEMRQKVGEFNQIMGLRSEERSGTLILLKNAWESAKEHLKNQGAK